jgi:hypothetical protein
MYGILDRLERVDLYLWKRLWINDMNWYDVNSVVKDCVRN